jgi:NADH dehydrogenase
MLTFAIVGGGTTGVEFAGALAELLRGPISRDFHALDLGEASILVIEATDRLLPAFGPSCRKYALERLGRMGIEVRLNAPVVGVHPGEIELGGGVRIETDTVVWTAGVRADPAPGAWGLPADAGGRIEVLPTLQVVGHPEVFVVGDLAAVRDGGRPLPMLATVAIQEGEAAARNIGLIAEGMPPEPFRYRDPGTLATIGRNAAVARVRGFSSTGFAAWLLWLGVHIYRLIGFRRRLSVLASWALDYVLQERAVRLILTACDARRGRRPSPGPEGAGGSRG